MYTEIEVFKEINKFLNNSKEDIDMAYNVHRKLISIIPDDLKDICFFRYIDKAGTIGLNMKNYKIYEYHHNKNESFRIIYPNNKISELEKIGLKDIVDFKFISIPASLLEIQVKDFDKLEDSHWESIREGILLASNGKDMDNNINNIEIDWTNI